MNSHNDDDAQEEKHPVAKKGVIFVDMDGTMVIQQPDHHLEPYFNMQFNQRETLINYLKRASIDYDVVVCTARPDLLEKFIKSHVGSIHTEGVVNLLRERGVKVKDVIKTDHFWDKKGKKMAEYLDTHPEYVRGYLLDDQMKHAYDIVEKGHHDRLISYDINSPEDMKKFTQLIGTKTRDDGKNHNHHFFAPNDIINFVIREFKIPEKKQDDVKNARKQSIHVSSRDKLAWLQKKYGDANKAITLYKILQSNNSNEKKQIINIIDHIALGLYEPTFAKYTPMLKAMDLRGKFVYELMAKIENAQSPTVQDIAMAQKKFNGIAGKMLNSQCDIQIQKLLDILMKKAKQLAPTGMPYVEKVHEIKWTMDESKSSSQFRTTQIKKLQQLKNACTNPWQEMAIEQISNVIKQLRRLDVAQARLVKANSCIKKVEVDKFCDKNQVIREAKLHLKKTKNLLSKVSSQKNEIARCIKIMKEPWWVKLFLTLQDAPLIGNYFETQLEKLHQLERTMTGLNRRINQLDLQMKHQQALLLNLNLETKPKKTKKDDIVDPYKI